MFQEGTGQNINTKAKWHAKIVANQDTIIIIHEIINSKNKNKKVPKKVL